MTVMADAPSRGVRPANLEVDRVTRQILAVCDAVGAFIEVWGFKSIHGRVWGLLALRREPATQVEIAQTLGVSRSLVNLAISELLEYRLVRPVGTHRNAPYEARVDVWPTITDVLRDREWMLMERARVALESAIYEVEFAEDSGEDVPYALERLKLILGMTEFAQASLRAIMAVRMPGNLDSFGDWLMRASKFVRRMHGKFPKLL